MRQIPGYAELVVTVVEDNVDRADERMGRKEPDFDDALNGDGYGEDE